MSLDEREIAAARAVFGAEADDAIAGLTRDLLALEQPQADADAARIRERVRGALHTVKGSAGMVGLAEVAALLHAVESALEARPGSGREPPEVVTALLDALDTVRCWIERSPSGRGVTPAELDLATRALAAPAARPAPARAEAAPPAPPDAAAGSEPGPAAGRDSSKEASRAFVHASTAMLDGLLGRAEDLVMGAASLRARVASLAGAREQLEALLRAQRGSAERAAPARLALDGVARLNQALDAVARELAGDSERLDTLTSAMLDGLRELRMVPLGDLCATFHRPIREMARELGKTVRLEVVAGDVRLDKQVLEGLKAPLVHLLRNAVAHGIESPARRAEAGKPASGSIRVGAERRGNRVVIVVADDGGGLDVAAVRDEAVRRGLLGAATPPLTVEAAAEIVFQPGFSTRAAASPAAGRGVGLSVVRESVERLRGEVRLSSRPGAGSEFTLTIPLSIAAGRGLLVRVGGDLFALPVLAVERVARVAARQVRVLQGVATVEVDGQPVRLSSLAALLGRPDARVDGAGGAPVVLIAGVRSRVALQVDAIVGELAIVVKDLPPPLATIDVLDGATVLDDGRVVPVLSAEGLARAGGEGAAATASAPEPRRLLVVDDSASTRLLLARELEAAGYRVATAADGAQALAILETEQVHAVVSDVNMPNVDGLELTRTVRATPALSNLPVLLVTSADTEADRVRGADAGADGYFVKKSFTREAVLAVLEQAMRRRGVA